MTGKQSHKSALNSATDGLPVAPSIEPTLQGANVLPQRTLIGRRGLYLTAIAMIIALAAGFIAQGLTHLIGLITNIAFYGRLSTEFVSPEGHRLGLFVIAVPVIGGILVGLMARYGSAGIRGHGIPEAMEQVLTNKSRISPRMTFLKPLSAAIAIGTGGPFGAEGPIIATGGAFGSLVGQFLKTTADERKTLLAAGAAAGMTATFGSPISAVLLAIELLLFEFRPRSIIPVALACATAAALRVAFIGRMDPVFAMSDLVSPSESALISYVFLGAFIGVISVFVTRAVYFIEDSFERLPVHWMWWPALGGLAVGIIGYFFPQTMGVGYENIENIISGSLAVKALVILCVFKFLSWSIALGSGTSGGTLAPLFTIGGAVGALLGGLAAAFFPQLGIDIRLAALVGMAAIFAGSSRALLTSIVFAFETTQQPMSLLPLLIGCASAYLVSSLLMKQTIMTEKIARRGIHVPVEYASDALAQKRVKEHAAYKVVALQADRSVKSVRAWLTSGEPGSGHQGFPVLDRDGKLTGVVTRRDLFDFQGPPDAPLSGIIKRPPVVVHENSSIREAVDLMAENGIGRLPVISTENPQTAAAMLSRSDILSAYASSMKEAGRSQQGIRLKKGRFIFRK